MKKKTKIMLLISTVLVIVVAIIFGLQFRKKESENAIIEAKTQIIEIDKYIEIHLYVEQGSLNCWNNEVVKYNWYWHYTSYAEENEYIVDIDGFRIYKYGNTNEIYVEDDEFLISENGAYYGVVDYRVLERDQDTGAFHTIKSNFETFNIDEIYNIDKTPPTISTALETTSKTTQSVTVSIGVTDSLSGFSQVEWYYKKSTDSEYALYTTDITLPVNYDEAGPTDKVIRKVAINKLTTGTYNIKARVYDVAGNSTESSVVTVTLDPVPTLVKDNNVTFTTTPTGWTQGPVTVKATTTVSGYTLQVSADNENWQDKDTTSRALNGAVYARLTDGTNAGGAATINITNIDPTKPTVTLSQNGGKYVMPTSGNATIKTKITAVDEGGSGLSQLQYAWTQSNTTPPTNWITFTNGQEIIKSDITAPGNWYLWTNVTDGAGNIATTIKTSNAFEVEASTETTRIVTYDYTTNGGTSASKTTDTKRTGENVDLSVTAEKTGYEFVGWSKEPNSTTILTSMTIGTEDVTLYAVFKKQVKLTFIDYEQTEEGLAQVTRTRTITIFNKGGETTAFAINEYPGWTTRYWTIGTTADSVKEIESEGIITGITENKTYYARYTKEITIGFNLNGGTGTIPSAIKGNIETNAININNVKEANITMPNVETTKVGYTFGGWNTKANGTGISYDDRGTGSFGSDTTLYAKWVQDETKYTVTYNYAENGGTSASKATDTKRTGEKVDLNVTAQKGDYEFVGWNTNKDATTGLDTITIGTNNITLYAIYKKDIKLTFIDYKGTQQTQTTKDLTIYNKGTGTTVAPTINQYTGWTAQYWTVGEDADAPKAFLAGEEITNIDESATYYARYSKTSTIKFNLNGGQGTEVADIKNNIEVNSKNINVVKNTKATIPQIEATREGYKAVCWNTKADGTGVDYVAGESLEATKDMTLYIRWETTGGTVDDPITVVPEITVDKPEGWTNKGIPVKIKQASGTGKIKRVTVNGTEIQSVNNEYNYEIKENGTYTIEIEDENNNTIRKEITITSIDKTAPVVSDIKNSSKDEVQTEAVIELKLQDNESGVAKVEYSYDGTTWNDCLDKNIQKDFTVTSYSYQAGESTISMKWTEEIDKTIYFRVTDNIGNVSEVKSTKVKLNKAEQPSVPDNNDNPSNPNTNNGDNVQSSNGRKDDTIAPGILPDAGNARIIILVVSVLILTIVAIIFIKKYKSLKEIIK